NGGGFFGANFPHPLQKPRAWGNFLTCINILLFPFSLIIMFGRMLGNLRHASVIFGGMMTMFVAMIVWGIDWGTRQPNPGLTAHPALTNRDGQPYQIGVEDKDGKVTEEPLSIPALVGLPVDQSLGNLEGKELRFGTSAGATYSAVTTAVTCGSVNCMH